MMHHLIIIGLLVATPRLAAQFPADVQHERWHRVIH